MNELTSIVIAAWNQLAYSIQCIESIRRFTEVPYELILIDNGSHDDTLNYFKSIPEATIVRNHVNKGFATACNQGMQLAKGDNILLLNNDTVVSVNWLANMVNCLHSQQEIGLVTCYTNYVGSENCWPATYRTIDEFHTFAQSFNRPDPTKWWVANLDWVAGFCLLLKRELMQDIGLLDEQFTYGNHEDVDYCYRTNLAGYKIYIAGDTYIHHYGNQTFTGNNLPYSAILAQNKILFEKKWAKNE